MDFKADRELYLFGPLALLDHDVLKQHFTPDVIESILDQLPESFRSDETQAAILGIERQTYYGLVMKQDAGPIALASFSLTQLEKSYLVEVVDKAMRNLNIKIPSIEDGKDASLTPRQHNSILRRVLNPGPDVRLHVDQDWVVNGRIQMLTYCRTARYEFKFRFFQAPNGSFAAEDLNSKVCLLFWLWVL